MKELSDVKTFLFNITNLHWVDCPRGWYYYYHYKNLFICFQNVSPTLASSKHVKHVGGILNIGRSSAQEFICEREKNYGLAMLFGV